MSAQLPDVGRPKGSAWRRLQDEGIVWEGQVLITGDDTDLAALLIVTNERLAFVRGGTIALDIERDWLDPAPVLRRTGTVQLWVSPPGDPVAESLTFIARDGRDEAAVLLSLINDGTAFGAAFQMPTYVPDSLPPRPNYPAAPSRRNDSWDYAGYESPPAALPVYSLLDDDDFPPVSTEQEDMPAWEEAIAEALVPGQSIPLAGSIRNPNDPIKPIDGFDSKYARDRRSWVIRLVGLFLLVGFGSIIASGILPDVDDIRGLIDNGTSTPLAVAETSNPTPITVAQSVDPSPTPTIETETSLPTATSTLPGPSSSDPRYPTVVPIETAVVLGVGGDNSHTPPPPTATTDPTPTSTVAQQDATSAQSSEEPAPTEETTSSSGDLVIPDPDENFTPSPSPTATAAPQPTETAVVETPTEEPSETPAQTVASDGLQLTINDVQRGERLPDLTLGRNSVGEWVVVLAEVSNTSAEPIELPMSALQLAPTSDLSATVALDSASSAVASYLGMNPTVRADAAATIPAGGVQPLALVFSIPAGAGDLTLLFGDQPFDLSVNTASDSSMQIEATGFEFSSGRRASSDGVLVAASTTPLQTASGSRFAGWLASEATADASPTSY